LRCLPINWCRPRKAAKDSIYPTHIGVSDEFEEAWEITPQNVTDLPIFPVFEKIGGVEKIPTKYAHFVEFGTAPHPAGKGDLTNETLLSRKGAKRKAQGAIHPGSAPFPFLRRAWDGNKIKAIDVIAKVLTDTIQEGSA